MSSTDLIRSYRAKRKLSQDDMAKKLDISRQTYNSLENDLLNNDCMIVFKILKILDLSSIEIDEFFNVLRQDYMSYNLEENV